VEKAKAWVVGDPFDPKVQQGPQVRKLDKTQLVVRYKNINDVHQSTNIFVYVRLTRNSLRRFFHILSMEREKEQPF